ncbi:MAG TPA: SRPBCC family protein, partial [Candidatus Dormibacteraeota bacterium]
MQNACNGERLNTLSVCPSAVVQAPVERVWSLLTRPDGFDLWADAIVVGAEPEGPAQPGQLIHLVASALTWRFAVTIEVREVDPDRRRLRFVVELPLGLVNDEVVTMADLGQEGTLVRFGRDFSFPPGWRGRLVRILMARELRRGPEDALAR